MTETANRISVIFLELSILNINRFLATFVNHNRHLVVEIMNNDTEDNVGNNVENLTQINRETLYAAIREIQKQNPYTTTIQRSALQSVSDRTIERDLANIQEEGSLVRERTFAGRMIIESHAQKEPSLSGRLLDESSRIS